jgi:hypothetical protein
VERAFKCRGISSRNEITEFSSKFERFPFAIYRDCFDTEIGMQYVRGYNGVERAFKRRNISIRNEITVFSFKFESLRFAICSACFDAETDVHYVRRVERSGESV